MELKISALLKSTLFASCVAFSFAACSDDEEGLASSTLLNDISIEGIECRQNVDEEKQTVLLTLPSNVSDASDVTVSFDVSEDAKVLVNDYYEAVDGKATMDLNRPAKFTIVAPNGDRAHWTIAATNNDYTIDYGLGYMLTESNSLQPARQEEGFSPYRNQYENTPGPNNNCGPACAAMGFNWGHTSRTLTPEQARSFDTANAQWTARTVCNCIDMYGGVGGVRVVGAEMTALPFSYTEENVPEKYTKFLKETIDAGRLVITVVNNADNTYNPNPEQHTHRFYQSTANHILVYKGYRVVDGITWIEVYDPAGSGDTAKYADGSWKGENRYYLATDLAKAIVSKEIGIVCTVWYPKEAGN